jgi:hypothetical protein
MSTAILKKSIFHKVYRYKTGTLKYEKLNPNYINIIKVTEVMRILGLKNVYRIFGCIMAATYLAGNLYKYPCPSSLQRITRSAAKNSPAIHLSPLGAVTEHRTEKSPAS